MPIFSHSRKRMCQNDASSFRYIIIVLPFFIEYDLCFSYVHAFWGIMCVDGLCHPYILIIFVCHLLIFDFSTHFLYIKSNGKEGKVHCGLVFSKMPEPLYPMSYLICPKTASGSMHLAPMFDTFSEVSLSRAFCLYSFQPLIDSMVRLGDFELKHTI